MTVKDVLTILDYEKKHTTIISRVASACVQPNELLRLEVESQLIIGKLSDAMAGAISEMGGEMLFPSMIVAFASILESSMGEFGEIIKSSKPLTAEKARVLDQALAIVTATRKKGRSWPS